MVNGIPPGVSQVLLFHSFFSECLPAELPYDTWQFILTEPGFFKPKELLDLQRTCKNFLLSLRPLVFRHINLLDWQRGWVFLDTITAPGFDMSISTEFTRVLQVSFSLADDEEEEEDGKNRRTPQMFWQRLGNSLAHMKKIHSLNVAYEHGDPDFVNQMLSLATYFPNATIQKLHFFPIWEETHLNVCEPCF